MTGLTILPFAWDGVPPWESADAYEEDLRLCRQQGHDLSAGFNGNGTEFLLCLRCDALFEEVAP